MMGGRRVLNRLRDWVAPRRIDATRILVNNSRCSTNAAMLAPPVCCLPYPVVPVANSLVLGADVAAKDIRCVSRVSWQRIAIRGREAAHFDGLVPTTAPFAEVNSPRVGDQKRGQAEHDREGRKDSGTHPSGDEEAQAYPAEQDRWPADQKLVAGSRTHADGVEHQ